MLHTLKAAQAAFLTALLAPTDLTEPTTSEEREKFAQAFGGEIEKSTGVIREHGESADDFLTRAVRESSGDDDADYETRYGRRIGFVLNTFSMAGENAPPVPREFGKAFFIGQTFGDWTPASEVAQPVLGEWLNNTPVLES